MRNVIVGIVFLVLVGAVYAQDNKVDPDAFRAAQERLQAKAAEKNAARAEMVSISRGELEDLRARVRELEATVANLRGPATSPTAKAKPRNGIEPGMTREELEKFVKSRLGTLRINVQSVTMTQGHKTETLTVERIAKVSRPVGTKTDFLGGGHAVYASGEEVQGSARVTLVDGVVTEVAGQ